MEYRGPNYTPSPGALARSMVGSVIERGQAVSCAWRNSTARRLWLERSDRWGWIGSLRGRADRRGQRVLRQIVCDALGRRMPPAEPGHRRLLLVCGTLGGGGAEHQLVNTALGMADRGWVVETLCQNLSGTERQVHRERLEDHGIPVRALERETTRAISPRIGARLAAASMGLSETGARDLRGFAQAIAAFRPSVVHTWLDEVNVKAGLAAQHLGVPRLVIGARSGAPWRFLFYRRYMRFGYQLLAQCMRTALLANSNAGAADYAGWLGMEPARLRVVRNALAPESLAEPAAEEIRSWRRQLGVPRDAPLVGAVMRLSEEKRPLLWVAAAAEVARSRPDARFVILGDGPLASAVRAAAARRGLASRLSLPGFEPNAALAIASLDVLLLTSRYEGLPNVVIEAQALGVPAVVTAQGGSPEALEPGLSGWVVAGSDPRALAERVLAVLSDDAWRERASQHARRLARERFALERMLEATEAVYLEGGR